MSFRTSLPAATRTNAAVIEDWCHTKHELKTFQLVWTIYHFSSRREANGQYVESSIFPADFDAPKWILRAYPRGRCENYKEYLAIDIVLHSGTKVSAKVKCSIVNDKNEKFQTHESRTCSFEKGECLYFRDLITRHALLKSGAGLLPQDTLTILCEVNVVNRSVNISGQTHAVKFLVPPYNLSEDLGALYDNEQFSDVKLIAGGHELKAHKAILSARSKVFAAMFQHHMRERISDRVPITDVHHEVLKEMLRFMYTDKVSNMDAMAEELLAVSDKYEIINLKVMCEESLRANLTFENAAITLILADRHNAKELKSEILNFIVGNAKAVSHTEGWRDMATTHAALIAEAFSAMAETQLPTDEQVPCKRIKK